MTLYFNAAIDSDFAVLGNWWTDANHTVQASALPAATDDVVIDSGLWSLGADRTVANVTVTSEFAATDYTLTVTGVCVFNGGSSNSGTINGSCVFNGGGQHSGLAGGTITGDCEFNDSSYNYGPIAGNCTFNGSGYNAGNITGNCVFNGTSYNGGSGLAITVTGNCVFNDSSYNFGTSDSTYTGDYTFNDSSYNYGSDFTITGKVVFNDSSYNTSSFTLTGICTFNDSSFNGTSGGVSGITGDCVFYDSSHNGGFIEGSPADGVITGTMYLRMRAAEFVATWNAGGTGGTGLWKGAATDVVIQFREMDVIGTGLN